MQLITNKMMTIISHEYITRIKSKGFIIGTIAGPLGFLLFIGIVSFATYLSINEESDKRLLVLDKSEYVGKEIIEADTSKFSLTSLSKDKLEKMILDNEIDGFLLIPEDIMDSGQAYVYTGEGGSLTLFAKIEQKLRRIVSHHRLKESGVSDDLINKIDSGIELVTNKITEKGTEKDQAEINAGIGYILGFLIYFMMIFYGSFVMRGVTEEKANRIIEVIASSVRPYEIMMGKVLGIGLVGLTQVTIWFSLAAIILGVGASFIQLPQGFEMPSISIGIFAAFIFYFLTGYFLYSTLYAAVGSAVDQESDAAQLSMPITMVVVLPMLFISVIISNPGGTIATVLSLIPFFSPILMIIRIAASTVPVWQIALSMLLMISTFIGAIWISAKIYRVGILMTGKRPGFKDMIKWLKA